MPATVIFAPKDPYLIDGDLSVFLAGSIDMGQAIDWQTTVTEALADRICTFLNPRRPNWEWSEGFVGEEFEKQVNWELDRLEQCDIVALYLTKDSKAPISLLELGFVSRMSKRIIVGCEEGFYRKGNVEIMCRRYGMRLVDNMEDFIKGVGRLITETSENP